MLHRREIALRQGIRLASSIGMAGALSISIARAGDLDSRIALDIPHQNLATALTSLAKQADLQILFSQELVAGIRSTALSGSYSGTEALERLLSASNLEYVVDGSDTVVIRPRKRIQRISQVTREAGPAAEPPDSSPERSSPPIDDEIIVTAQKREERLQDVPVAVTALSGEMLASAGVAETKNLVAMTPSLTYTEGAHPANKSFRIRGIGTAVFGQGLEPSVSVVMDGIVLARAAQSFSDLGDIERIEVLRGPQGTLFGKNSVGGLVNVVTKRPSSELEGTVDIMVAEQDEYRVRSTISGPISDNMGARLTGYYSDVGGHIRNVVLDRDMNGYEEFGLRGKFEWDPTDRLNLLLTADYREGDSECCAYQYVLATNPLLEQLVAPANVGFNNRESVDNLLTTADIEQFTLSLEGNLELEAATLASLTAYQDFSVENAQPIDAMNTPTPLYLPATNGRYDINDGTLDIRQVSQELRIASVGANSFNYVAGLYLLDMDLDRGFERRVGNCAPGGTPAAFGQPCAIPLYSSQAGFHSSLGTKNAALFGQVDFPLVGSLSALAGARVQYEEISYTGTRLDQRVVEGDLPLPGLAPSSGSGKSDDTVVTGKAGLKYEFNRDAQTYFTWSTGYKGAGYEVEFTSTFENQRPIEPETAEAWELGFKARLWDVLSVNTAVFRADYEDLQVQANRGNPDLGVVHFATTNAGKSRTEGVEVEFSLQPLTGLTFRGGVTYLSTSADIDGVNCPLSQQQAAPVIVGSSPTNLCYRPAAGIAPIQNVRGGDLPNAPRWRGNLTARYELDLPGTQLASFVQVTGNSQSKINFVIEQDPLTVQDGYTTVDASIGLSDRDNRYRFSLFVRNLFDEHYVNTLVRSATLTTATLTPNNLLGTIPKEANRYFGATFGMSF